MNLRVSPARPRRGAIEAFDQRRAGLSRLPDFLDLEDGGEFALLGQDEPDTSVFESALRDQIARSAAKGEWPAQDTERIILAAARVGQHAFALNVPTNCGGRCVFCGLNPSPGVASRMLLAGHIKPWKDSSAIERLDPRNGLAACPSHDVAFDTGMLTVTADLKIHIGQPLADAARGDYLTRQYNAARRSWTPCCSPTTPNVPGADTSTGTARKSSSPNRQPKCAPASKMPACHPTIRARVHRPRVSATLATIPSDASSCAESAPSCGAGRTRECLAARRRRPPERP